jgi:hypothetical protein
MGTVSYSIHLVNGVDQRGSANAPAASTGAVVTLRVSITWK